ncbi:uncharacterized protein [Diadema antillarum]|uniref:uncharacterized protein n=1 Tax=Diadema antillarum TaxID=105358 RepID=UPI003A857EF4
MGTQLKGRFLLRHVSLVKYCCLVVFLSLLITMIQWMNVNTPSEFAAAKHSKFWRHNRKTIQKPAAREEVFNPIPRNVMDVSEYHAISVDGVEARHRRSQNNVKNRASRENPSDKERDSEKKVLTLGINDSQLFEHTANHTLNGIDSNQTNAKNNQSPDGAFRKRNHVKLPENKGQESRNKTLSTRKVKIIRRIMRRGKTIREEVVGVRTMHNQEVDIENAYIKSWYGVNRSLTAAKLQLTNTSPGDSLILTDDLWEFADQTSERLFLYGKLFQHNWQQNKTNTRRLREELRGIGMNAEENLLATRQNTPPNIGLPFYISTKVVVNKTKRRVPYFNATETFRRHLPDVSPSMELGSV